MEFDPSLLHTQMSSAPDRSDIKAILFPSGEYAGFDSLRVDEINRTGVPGLRTSIFQMSVSDFCTTYARRLP